MKFSEMTKYGKRRRVLSIVFAACAAVVVVGTGAWLLALELSYDAGAPGVSVLDGAAAWLAASLFAAVWLAVLGDLYVVGRYFLGEPEKKRPLFTVMNAYALVCAELAVVLFLWQIADVWDSDEVLLRFAVCRFWAWMESANIILRFLYLALSVSDGPKDAASGAVDEIAPRP